MPGRYSHGQSGFTVVEMMIALSIFFLVLGGIFQIFGPSNVMYAAGHRKLDAQQTARVAMDMMVRQIRMAGYFPENFDANTDPNFPHAVATVVQNSPIQVATNTALAIYGAATGCLDANGDAACDPDQTPGAQPRSQVFLFCLDGTTLLTKAGALGVATSYTCDVQNANQEAVADNITGLTFTYYDGDNNSLAGPLDGEGLGGAPIFANTAQRAAVRTVAITVTAQENVPGQAPQVYSLSSTVRLRNLN